MAKLFAVFAGATAGFFAGLVATLILAQPLCWLFGVSSFEGASGYFVLFMVTPTLAIIVILSGSTLAWKASSESSRRSEATHNRLRQKIGQQEDHKTDL